MNLDFHLPPLSCSQTWSPTGFPRIGFPPQHQLARLLREECRRLAGEALWGRLEAYEAQVEETEVHTGDDRLVLAGSLAAEALRRGFDALLGRTPSKVSLLPPRPYSTFRGEVADIWHCFADSTALLRREDVRGESSTTIIPVSSGSLLGGDYRQDLVRKHYLQRNIHGERTADGHIGGQGWQASAAKEVISRRIDFAPLGVALDLRSGEAFVHREALRAALLLRVRVPDDYCRLVQHHILPSEMQWSPPLVVETALPTIKSLLLGLAPLRRQRGLDLDVSERICGHFLPLYIRHHMPFHRYIEIYFRRLVYTGTCVDRLISTWWLQHQKQPRTCCAGEISIRDYIELLVSHPAVQKLTPGMASEALIWSFSQSVSAPAEEEEEETHGGGDLATGPPWGAAIAAAIVAETPPPRGDLASITNVAAGIVAPLIPIPWQSVARVRIFESSGYTCHPDVTTEWPTPSLFV